MSRAYAEYKKAHPAAKHKTVLKGISPVYGPGRTKQAFKDQTDINKILHKAQKTGTISHMNQYQGEYGDFTDMPDLLEAQGRLNRGKEIFDALPAEVRRDFNQNPADFFAFVNDPENVDQLAKVLPEVAEPGDYVPKVIRTAANMNEPGDVGAPTTADPVPDPVSGGDA